MNTDHNTRRGVIVGAGATVAAAIWLKGLPAAAQAPPPRKRRNVEELSAADITVYEHAIKVLKDRSGVNPDDPKGYEYWAGLHDNADLSIHSGCSHFSERFFPWHRQFLFDFETVLRESDPPTTSNITIPYWDWSHTPKTGPYFPAVFDAPASPLHNTRRKPAPWDPADIQRMIHEPDWSLFAGKPDPAEGFGQHIGDVEGGPHNHLHGAIGRNMANSATACQDPIFWSFHAFIELVWVRWQRLHVTPTTPQPFVDPAALIWFRDRSFTVGSTALLSNQVEYEFNFSPDGPAATAVPAMPSPPGAPDKRIVSPPKTVVALAPVPRPGPDVRLWARPGAVTPSDTVFRLDGIRVFADRSYNLDLYVHPKSVVISALPAKARVKYLMRSVGLWRAHHPTMVEAFVRPTAEQIAQLNRGWIITIRSEPVGEVPTQGAPGPHAHAPMAAPPTDLPPTRDLMRSLELQVR